MSSSGHQVDYVRKGIIVLVLLGFVIFSHQYVVHEGAHDPRGLFALGFVILASYIIGELVELIKLPHITGYLLGGLFLGPSLGETLHKFYPSIELIPPFDHGILNFDIIQQLGLLDTLALPLICLTAGGALRPKEIWKSKYPISGLLIGQVLAMFIGIIGLFYLMSGPVSFLTLPQLAELSLPAVLALGAVAASISIATSDAATIAIVVSAKARGPMTTNIISVAVLKDIVVVIAFSATTAIATATLGVSSGETLQDSLIAIAISCFGGVLLGGGIHLYLKLVGQELVLFLVGLIFTVSFISDALHLESALMFIVAGFVIANWSKHGDQLIKEVERVSTPVFVVFFTLAGAKLHLDVLASIIILALALVAVRAGAFFIGCRMGGMLSGADQASQKYAWMGFVSQAGLAITLANTFPSTYGAELGGALFSFILGGVAIHELIGPAMLQAALGLAKELPASESDSDKKETADSTKHQSKIDWGTTTPTSSDQLNQQANTLTQALTVWTDNLLETTVKPRITELRLTSEADGIATCLRLSQTTTLKAWDTKTALHDLDLIIDDLSDGILSEIEADSYLPKPQDGIIKRSLKGVARIRFKLFKPKRLVDVRALGRYYFSGMAPQALIQVAEEMLAVERNAAEQRQALEREELTHAAYLKFLEEAEQQIIHRLYITLQRLYRYFSIDIKDYATVSCPAVSRRFRLVFDDRNNGIMTLVEHKSHWEELASARWNAAALKLISYQTQKHISQHIHTQSESLKTHLHTTKEQINKIHELMLEPSSDQWGEWCLSLKHDIAQVIVLIEQIGPLEQWFAVSIDSGFRQHGIPDSLTINTNTNSILWSQIEPLSNWTVFPNTVLIETIQRSNDDISQLCSATNQDRQNLLSLFNEIISVLDFYTAQSEQDLATISRLSLRLSELSPRFHEQSDLLLQNIQTQFSEQLNKIDKLWFKPASTPQPQVVRSIRGSFQTALTALREQLFTLFSSQNRTITPPDSYSRLFTTSTREVVVTPDRVALRQEIQGCIQQAQSVVLCGDAFETTPLLQNIFRNSNRHTFFKNPSSIISSEELHSWIKSAKDRVLIIANAEFAIPFYGLDHGASEQLHKWTEQNNCTLVIGLPSTVWSEICRATTLHYTIRNVFKLPPLTQENLHKLLLTRHLISGYELQFAQRRNIFARLMEELHLIHPVETTWMTELMEISQGNRLEASRCWLNSIAAIDEKNAVLRLSSSPKTPTLSTTSDELILCRQIIRFGWITPMMVSNTFDCSKGAAESWLDSLVNSHLLENSGDVYLLNELYVFPISQQLQNRGWLS